MNTLKRIFWLIFTLPVYCFGANFANVDSTTYVVEQSPLASTMLTVRVDRANHHFATKLILRGIRMGIPNQVQNVTCDGRIVKEHKPGTWPISKDCRDLSWQISLLESGKDTPAEQQSLKSGDFVLLSESSSLPRLEDARDPEAIKVGIEDTKTLFPKADVNGLIHFPKSSAPFYILINAAMVGSVSSGLINLTHYLDNPKSTNILPSIDAHMKGLQWLNEVIPGKKEQSFIVAWLGISKNKMGIGGAAGENILLANYPNDGELKFGNAMLFYIALHEAFHQFAMQYPDQPSWVAESLASYYGARAMLIALPNDSGSYALIERFQTDGDQITDGLLAINRKVQIGDRSGYGAFYTKGLSFWTAVDKALQQKGDHLDHRITQLFQTNYYLSGEPVNMQKILDLNPETWASLHRQYLN